MSELIDKARNNYLGFRVALVGMIQAIALELAVSSAFEHEYFSELNALAWVAWAQLTTNLIVVFYVSITVASIASFQRIPKPIDFIAIFTVGISQFFSIGLLGGETIVAWCWVTAVTWVAAIPNLWISLSSGLRDEFAQNTISRFPRNRSFAAYLMMAAISALAALSYANNYSHWITGILLFGGVVIVAIASSWVFRWWYDQTGI